MMLYTIEMLAKLAAYTNNAKKYNIVGQETNQINRRLQKNGNYLETLIENALNERNQNVSIDQAKHEDLVSSEFDPFWRANREKRKGAYELYKLCGTKAEDGTYYPDEDSPRWKAEIANKKATLPMWNSAAALVIKYVEEKADKEIYWHKTWKDDKNYTVEATEYGLENINHIDDSMFVNSSIDLSGDIFDEYDFTDVWTNYTGKSEWSGSHTQNFYVFRYVNMFAYALKEIKANVNESILKMLVEVVSNKFSISADEAKEALAKEAFHYVFTDDAAIFQDGGFEQRAELLAQIFAETWMANQEANGQHVLETEIEELPFVDDDDENDLV